MGTCREGFNLFNKYGRGNFFRYLKRGIFQHLMWEDTFCQVWCWIIGHKIYDCNEGGTPEYACKRCHQYISVRFYKDRVFASTGAKKLSDGKNVEVGVTAHCKCGNIFCDNIKAGL